MFDCDTYIKLNYVLHFSKTSQNIEKINVYMYFVLQKFDNPKI